MKSLLLTVMAVLTASFVFAEAVNVTAYQRWPWNGKVDITYTIPDTGSAITPIYEVKFYVSINGGSPTLISAVEGEGASGILFGPGIRKAVWDAHADFPTLECCTAKIGITAEDISASAKYLKMDLATGKMVAGLEGPVVEKGADCKVTELWFKKVNPATFTMGSGSTEQKRESNETQHTVTITKPYYIALFELTQGQLKLMTGENPSYFQSAPHYKGADADFHPVEQISYNTLRGTSAGATWPTETDHRVDPTSLIGKMRAKFGNAIIFDLPTEAQWEMACRAVEKEDGTYEFRGDNVFNNGLPYVNIGGADSNLEKIAWTNSNCAKDENGDSESWITDFEGGYHTHEVGLKPPGGVGLYDMHGNVFELCLDWYADDITSLNYDPAGPETPQIFVINGVNRTYRCKRGGWISGSDKYFRMAYRGRSLVNSSDKFGGCRLVIVIR